MAITSIQLFSEAQDWFSLDTMFYYKTTFIVATSLFRSRCFSTCFHCLQSWFQSVFNLFFQSRCFISHINSFRHFLLLMLWDGLFRLGTFLGTLLCLCLGFCLCCSNGTRRLIGGRSSSTGSCSSWRSRVASFGTLRRRTLLG